jgi:hypothetical protein
MEREARSQVKAQTRGLVIQPENSHSPFTGGSSGSGHHGSENCIPNFVLNFIELRLGVLASWRFNPAPGWQSLTQRRKGAETQTRMS